MNKNATGKIIVVDDNPATLYSTSRVLRSAGYTVVEANTGTKALEAIHDDVDLVVLDINLPDIDGFEISRRLRSQPDTSSLPILHLSATFVDELDKVSGFDAGADGYLTHPVEPLVLLATVRAIFRARKAETATRQSEARFRAIFDRVPTGIALLTEDLNFVDANPAMSGLLAISRDGLIDGAGLSSILSDSETLVADVGRRLVDDGEWSRLACFVRHDGVCVDLEWYLSAFSPRMVLALATDVTERRRVEAERERLLESERASRTEAERANRLKDDFLATLSHELRNPLQTIVSWSAVYTGMIQDPKLRPGLEALDRSAGLLSHLIEDLLDVSRISSGKIHLTMADVDLERVLDSAVHAVVPSCAAKRMQIDRRRARESVVVQGDKDRIQQVAWNLLTNAVKFTPPGGTVSIATEVREGQVTLSVSDNGCGIAPDFLPRIFERFSQSNERDRKGGLGLGLAIVKSLVEMHGGTIAVASEGVGHGATFVVSLPVGSSSTAP